MAYVALMVSTLERLLLANTIGQSIVLSGALFLGQLIPFLSFYTLTPRTPPDVSTSGYRTLSYYRISYMFLLWLKPLSCCLGLVMSFFKSTQILWLSVIAKTRISDVTVEYLLW